jgi:hypothetical protein
MWMTWDASTTSKVPTLAKRSLYDLLVLRKRPPQSFLPVQ